MSAHAKNVPPGDDYLVRVLAKEASVRALACVTTGLARDTAVRQQLSPIAAAATAYGLTAAALLGALLKVQQRVAIKVNGNGPLGKMVVESDSYGHLRGYVAVPDLAWPAPVEGASVASALGRTGILTVVKDLGLKDLYESVVPIQTGELDADLVYYLIMSEQVPSLVEIGVKVDEEGELLAAGGALIQTLPGAEPAALSGFAERMDDLPPIESLLADGLTPEEVVAALFGQAPYDILERQTLVFRCGCSRERSEKALRMLEIADLDALIAEGEAVVDCHFCNARYVYGREVLEMIRDEVLGARQEPPSPG